MNLMDLKQLAADRGLAQSTLYQLRRRREALGQEHPVPVYSNGRNRLYDPVAYWEWYDRVVAPHPRSKGRAS